jgi:hypothetical protein
LVGWLLVECYSIDHISAVQQWLPEEMIIYFTYHVSSFDKVASSVSPSLFNNTVTLMMITQTNNDFAFEPVAETPSMGTYFFKFSQLADTSSLASSKPIQMHLFKSKKLTHFIKSLPTLSVAFWDALFWHFYKPPNNGAILDLLPGNNFCFFNL